MASKRQIHVGALPIGGGAPVAVQTMTKTETANLTATMEQIRTVADAGADIVRVAVPREQDAEALKSIVAQSPIPVIADIHFNHTLALKAIEAGAHCVRLNPGNIGGPEKVADVIALAKQRGTPLRVGVNSGSLPKHLRQLEYDICAAADGLRWRPGRVGRARPGPTAARRSARKCGARRRPPRSRGVRAAPAARAGAGRACRPTSSGPPLWATGRAPSRSGGIRSAGDARGRAGARARRDRAAG